WPHPQRNASRGRFRYLPRLRSRPRRDPEFASLAEHDNALVDESQDDVGSLLVARARALAPPVEHQVVAEDRRVLVIGQRPIPAILVRVGAVHFADGIGRDVREADATQVEQRLAELRNLPVDHGRYPAALAEHVAEVVIAVNENRRPRTWFALDQ